MKRTLLFSVCIFASLALFAQDVYHTFLEEGKVWTCFYYNMVGKTYNVTRVVDGDTIIGGLAYKKICDKMGGNYQYALREEGKQVYIVHDHNETSQLLYDFSKDKGDIITKEVDEKSGMVYDKRVTGVDTIDIDGLRFRRLQIWMEEYNNQNPINWEEIEVPWQMASYWIEGVGSECLLETSFRGTGNYYNLASCQINGRTYTQQQLLKEPSKPQNDYLPFVKEGKKWSVVRSNFAESYHFDKYTMNEEVVKNGKTYMKMYRHKDLLDVVYDAGLLREEDRKVYYFDDEMQKEHLLFDYSLKAGDTYETYSYDEQKTVTYKVLSVSDYTAGPKVKRYEYDESADSTNILQRYLRKWTVCRADDNSLQKTWIECVGSIEGPLANLSDERPISSKYYLAYVENRDGDPFLPFSFHDMFGQIHGSNLPIGETYHSEDWHHQLTYELEGDRLHVYGKAFTNCGPNSYAYFFEEPTDEPLVRKLHFDIQEVEPVATCMFLHATDFYVPGFDPNMNYIVVDNQGEEHPVVNRTPQNEYWPFVEEGKVWKVGYGSNNPIQLVEYYYLDGDTIINGKTCKQMMCQRYVSSDYPDYDVISQQPSLRYVGAWFEEDKQVYKYDSTHHQFMLMYDFSVDANDTLQINSLPYVVGPRQSGGIKGFKGVYRDIVLCADGERVYSVPWLEGVGGTDRPTTSVYSGVVDPMWFLMSCTVGDEVIYLNDVFEDGATPEEARKHRFDFTHTVKTQPKAPASPQTSLRRASGTVREAEQPLYGEYNDLQLGIHLDPLDEAYLVRITDETGTVVYEKAVNAGTIVGLNIDISAYPKGLYTVTVENNRESFTGEIDTRTTGISLTPAFSQGDGAIYNLQGQRISSLQKGLNIVNRRKVFVK